MKLQTTNQPRNTRFHAFVLLALSVQLIIPSFLFSQPLNDEKPSISYIGNADGQPIVQVMLNNENESSCKLVMQDPEGNILYSASFRERNYLKKFLIDNPAQQNIELTITIYQGKTKHAQVVKISRATISNVEFSVTRL